MEKLIIASRKELDKTQKALEYFCEKVVSNVFGRASEVLEDYALAKAMGMNDE